MIPIVTDGGAKLIYNCSAGQTSNESVISYVNRQEHIYSVQYVEQRVRSKRWMHKLFIKGINQHISGIFIASPGWNIHN